MYFPWGETRALLFDCTIVFWQFLLCFCILSLPWLVTIWICPLWTIAHQAPLSMGFSRLEYWSGLPFPSPGIFPTQGSNPGLQHCRQTLYHLGHQEALGIQGWSRKLRASQVALAVKNPPASAGGLRDAGSDPWVGKIPWRRAQQPTLVFLPGESHGQRSLESYST